jgi:hypothetical protein
MPMAATERQPSRAHVLALALGCACVLLSGCQSPGEYQRLDVREVTSPSLPDSATMGPPLQSLGASEIDLFEGLAVQARVSALDDEGDPLPVLSLRSEDPAVFEVTRGVSLGRYIFVGISAGSTRLEVLSEGRRVGRVPVSVSRQMPR